MAGKRIKEWNEKKTTTKKKNKTKQPTERNKILI